jgi:hypothetical protein
MKRILAIFLCLILLPLEASAVRMPKVSAQKRIEMQTHYYNNANSQDVFNAAIETLQNSDFIIQDINPEYGYINARKTFKSNYVSKKRVLGWSTVFAAATAYTVFSYGSTAYSMYSPSRRVLNEMRKKNIIVDTNVFVEPMPDGTTKVRFLLVEKILQNADGFSFMKAAPMRIIRIYRPEVYDEFFSQVGENLSNKGI